MNEDTANDSGAAAPRPGTQVSLLPERKSIQGLARSILRGDDRPKTEPSISTEEAAGTRSVRRGKFFLSDYEQRLHGSLRRPIFEYWGHGVIVGEMHAPTRKEVGESEGVWCFGAHNDFDLIPTGTPLNEWPEYVRTSTGWVRKDGPRRISDQGTFSNAAPDALLKTTSLDDLLKLISTLKGLK